MKPVSILYAAIGLAAWWAAAAAAQTRPVLEAAPGVAGAKAQPPAAAQARGVVVSCYRYGPGEWDGPDMPRLLDELKGLGVTALQIHPYARVRNDGGVSYDARTDASTLPPFGWAKERGMGTFLKPHLAYWGSGFGWRGEISFSEEAQWRRFFEGYGRFIVRQAELAEAGGIDVFAVGTELHQTLHREADWRAVIADVREVYAGKLTYAANWNEVPDVPFWDALDLVGVQCYFPLTEKHSPTRRELEAGWAGVLETLRGHRDRHGKPVLLTELGYAESEAAASEPWEDRRVGGRAAGSALKLLCMDVALKQIDAQPWIAGVYLWKWFPGNRDHGDEFVLQYDAMRGVIRGAWGVGRPGGRWPR